MKKTFMTLSILSLLLTACSKPTHNAAEYVQTTPQTQTAAQHEIATPTVDSAHHAPSNLNWVGEYKGLLPCADCSGIETKLELKSNYRYELTEQYQDKGDGKEFKSEGSLNFDPSSNLITLNEDDPNPDRALKFFLGANFIELREFETGQKFDTLFAEQYKLKKELN